MAQELEHHPDLHVAQQRRPKRQGLQKLEGAADIMTIGLIVALGIAMLVGLVTASGQVSW